MLVNVNVHSDQNIPPEAQEEFPASIACLQQDQTSLQGHTHFPGQVCTSVRYDSKSSAEIIPPSVPEYLARVACLPEDQPSTQGHQFAPGLDFQHENLSSAQATTPSARVACLQGDQTSTRGHPLAPCLDCQKDNSSNVHDTPSLAPTECPARVACLQGDQTSTLAPSPTCQQDFNSAQDTPLLQLAPANTSESLGSFYTFSPGGTGSPFPPVLNVPVLATLGSEDETAPQRLESCGMNDSDSYRVSYEERTDNVTYRGRVAGQQECAEDRQEGLTEPAVTAPDSAKPLEQPILILCNDNKQLIPPELQQVDYEGWKRKVQMAGKSDSQPEEVESAQEDLSEFDERLRKIWKERREEWKEAEEKKKKARRLEEGWKLLRECRKIIQENSEGWERRSAEETKRIKERDKQERLEIVKTRKAKFKNSAWEKRERKELEGKTQRRLELVEVKRNIWKKFINEEGKLVAFNFIPAGTRNLEKDQKEKVAEEAGRKQEEEKKYLPLSDFFQQRRKEKQNRAAQMKKVWQDIREAIELIEEDDEDSWLAKEATWMEEKFHKVGRKKTIASWPQNKSRALTKSEATSTTKSKVESKLELSQPNYPAAGNASTIIPTIPSRTSLSEFVQHNLTGNNVNVVVSANSGYQKSLVTAETGNLGSKLGRKHLTGIVTGPGNEHIGNQQETSNLQETDTKFSKLVEMFEFRKCNVGNTEEICDRKESDRKGNKRQEISKGKSSDRKHDRVDRLGIQSSGKIARKRDEGYNSGNITPIRARKLVTAGISLFEDASGGKGLPDCRMELQGLQGKN